MEKRRRSALGLTDFSRYSCKFGDTQPLPPHVGGQTAVHKDVCQLLLGQLVPKGGVQSVDQGLPPLGKGSPHQAEELLEELCGNYCRYTSAANGKTGDELLDICEDCPLSRLGDLIGV